MFGALSTKAEVFLATGNLQAVEAPLLTNPQSGSALACCLPPVPAPLRWATEILSRALPTETDRNARNIEKLLLGLSQQRAGDVAAARATYQSAAQDIQRRLDKAAPGSFPEAGRMPGWVLAHAGLGEATPAIAEGQKAMAIDPTSKDPVEGPVERRDGEDLRSTGGCRSRDPHSQAAPADTVWRCDHSGAVAT